MNRRLQLVIIICAVVSITAIISHGIIAWTRIETTFGNHWMTKPEGGNNSTVFMAGSSLAGDGLSWGRISDDLNLRIEGWGVAGSSPCEWEFFQHRDIRFKQTILVVSAYDLNEYFLCDFRAEVVPLRQTIEDLWRSRADWPYSKRVLSLYPLTYVRTLFPTAGRSDGVMVGAREKFKSLLNSVVTIESEAGPTLSLNGTASTQEYKKEKISMWSPDRMLRRLSGMRNGCQGRHMFNGPKRMAFLRMLIQAQTQGHVVAVVLPVSPAYAQAFLTPEVRQEFEEMLTEAQHIVPQAHWVRLDQFNELDSNDYFWDLVHMNSYGQKIATEAFLGRLREIRSQP